MSNVGKCTEGMTRKGGVNPQSDDVAPRPSAPKGSSGSGAGQQRFKPYLSIRQELAVRFIEAYLKGGKYGSIQDSEDSIRARTLSAWALAVAETVLEEHQ